MLEKASKYEKYTYEVNVNVSETNEHFTQYFTPNAWYTEGGSDADFGYAQTKDKHYLFKYYFILQFMNMVDITITKLSLNYIQL